MPNATDVTIILELDPDDERDLTLEHEKELTERASYEARIAGFKSVRDFRLAALEALVKKQTARAKKVRAA